MKVRTSASSKPPLAPHGAPRGNLLAEVCPSRIVLEHLTGRWSVLVMKVLVDRPHRFAELRRTIGGVSDRMLTQTLRWLEGDGLVLRVADAAVPPQVEYSLTPLGREAATHLLGLADWIEDHVVQIVEERARRAR